MKIFKKNGDICPICKQFIRKNNFWVKYHIRYNPEICIVACKYCNFTEFLLRNPSKIDRPRCATPWRVDKVIAYHQKFGIEL